MKLDSNDEGQSPIEELQPKILQNKITSKSVQSQM